PRRGYLDVSEILRVAKESGADAIYPGYEFLAENPDLANACEQEGITFIGHAVRQGLLKGKKKTWQTRVTSCRRLYQVLTGYFVELKNNLASSTCTTTQ